MEFVGFPKISRLNRNIVITEKIDGTNAQVYIRPIEDDDYEQKRPIIAHDITAGLVMFAGSRTRWITPKDDNHGFARWVQAHSDELFKLGPGQHFGEWWGNGIQRAYGLPNGDKRFSLFNTARWGDPASRPSMVGVVPVLFEGKFNEPSIHHALESLRLYGSVVVPGFMKPEGIVVFHEHSRQLFKVTLEKDEEHKGQRAA